MIIHPHPHSLQCNPPSAPKCQSQPTAHKAKPSQRRHRTQRFERLSVQHKQVDRPREHRDSSCEERLRPNVLGSRMFGDDESHGVDELKCRWLLD